MKIKRNKGGKLPR